MSEDTPIVSIKDSLNKQTAIIIALQERMGGAIGRNNADDCAAFSQAILTATQTWLMFVEMQEKIKPKAATIQAVQPGATYQKSWEKAPNRRKAP